MPKPTLQSAVEKLTGAQRRLLAAADSVSAEKWNAPPDANCWSAAHLVAHLCQVERSVVGDADRVIGKSPRYIPYFQRFHIPFFVVEKRLIRRKSPIAMEAERLSGKETMLAELRRVRERTLAFLEETQHRDLSVYYWPHPFLGNLHFYNWFIFVGSHQIRHTKQLVQIAKNLPKRVVPSQN